MRSIFATCNPRDEVLQGELKEETFMARLKDVVEGKAAPIYQNPSTFFDNTYPTEGLKLLLAESLGRLTTNQSSYNSVIRLETAFGGGKTHNLIALYHAARGAVIPSTMGDPALVPSPGAVNVVGVVGSDLDPSFGIVHPDCTTYTIWGEIAYQLAGINGYQLVTESDTHSKAAPGTGLWEHLIGERPTLIMIDEVARHMRAARAIPTGTGQGTLADQVVAFLMSLLEFAASVSHVVVVLTLADSSDSFGQETDEIRQELHELSEAKHISSRQERVIIPTGETEIAAIVTHRLFYAIDDSAAQETANAYHAYYVTQQEQGTNLPSRAGRAEYASEIYQSYPFHPDLLTALNRKVSTIPDFQKTRGALRLLALVVRQLWQHQPSDTLLIHPYHIDLGLGQIAEDLTSRLARPSYKQVIEADIVSPLMGSQSHAQIIDAAWVAAGKPAYAQRVATTIFLHSLTQGVASGVVPADMILAALQPGDDPTMITKATDRLVDSCWFLAFDGNTYRFSPEPQLNKIVQDEMASVGLTKAKAEIDQRIQTIWRKEFLAPVFFPVETSDVEDETADMPQLCIIHYDDATVTATNTAPPDRVRQIAEYSGAAQRFRTYRNNILFLVADRDHVSHMVEVAKRFLAIERIVRDGGRLQEFTEEQRKQLKKMRDAQEIDVRLAITRAYRYFYYPSADAPADYGTLDCQTMPAQEQGSTQKNQTSIVLSVLHDLNKVLTVDGQPLAPAFIRSKAWEGQQPVMSTDDLRRAFARRIGLRILLDINPLKKSIREGINNRTWVYYDEQEGMGYDDTILPPTIKISQETKLYLPEEADRMHLPIKGKNNDNDKGKGKDTYGQEDTCPLCHYPQSKCVCGDNDDDSDSIDGTGDGRTLPSSLRTEGSPAQAFQALLDQCQEGNVAAVSFIELHIEGSDQSGASDSRLLGMAIPQLGKGTFTIRQEMVAEFESNETFQLRFQGGWGRYKSVKTLTDEFGKQATKLTMQSTLRIDFRDGLAVPSEDFERMRDIFDKLGMGRIVLQSEPYNEAS